MTVAGLLLAAGSGRRFGQPKALVDTGDGPWVVRALETLSGLSPRVVVVGAAAGQVIDLLAADVTPVNNPDADSGMGSSLRAGLAALDPTAVTATVVMLVDLPDVSAAVIRRVIEAGPVTPTTLRRAGFDGRPGHPVLLGSAHWAAVVADAEGDRGARNYLSTSGVVVIECGDLAQGHDRDRPDS